MNEAVGWDGVSSGTASNFPLVERVQHNSCTAFSSLSCEKVESSSRKEAGELPREDCKTRYGFVAIVCTTKGEEQK